MTNQEILDKAPEGATHYAPNMCYIARNSNGKWMRHNPNGVGGLFWFIADDYKFEWVSDFRSLDDIRRIVELESDLRFFLEQSMIIEHEQDHETIQKLRDKYGMEW